MCVTRFLGNVELETCDANGIVGCIKNLLASYDTPVEKCFGLSSDGASVMTGKDNGVAAILKRTHCPHMISVHCIAHRVALATSQAAASVNVVKRYEKELGAIYSYFKHSASRTNKLAEMQKIFDDPHIQLKKIFEVRWLSFHSAVDSMRRTLVSVMATLEADAAEGDPSASGLLKTMRSYNFICLTNLLTDVLGIITKLSKLFQKEVLDFSVIQPSISNSTEALLQLKDHDGLHLTTCKQEICGNMYHNQPIENSSAQQRTFESAKSQFIQAVVDNMRSRFPDIGVLSACQIFDPQNLPKNPTDLVSYGNTQLDVLLKHYSPKVPATTVSASSSVTDTQPLINAEECRSEFVLFKQFTFRTFPNKCYPELIKGSY